MRNHLDRLLLEAALRSKRARTRQDGVSIGTGSSPDPEFLLEFCGRSKADGGGAGGGGYVGQTGKRWIGGEVGRGEAGGGGLETTWRRRQARRRKSWQRPGSVGCRWWSRRMGSDPCFLYHLRARREAA